MSRGFIETECTFADYPLFSTRMAILEVHLTTQFIILQQVVLIYIKLQEYWPIINSIITS